MLNIQIYSIVPPDKIQIAIHKKFIIYAIDSCKTRIVKVM